MNKTINFCKCHALMYYYFTPLEVLGRPENVTLKVVAKIIPTLICWLRPINETEWIGYQCTSQSQPQQLSFFTFKYSSA